MDRKSVGKLGEQLAADYLERNGYEIIARNFRTRYGELDIVAKDKDAIIFVEVKTRSSDMFGAPEEAITRDKQDKLRLMAEYFLLAKKMSASRYQIDSIGITINDGKAKLKHLKNIIAGV